jgi:uncharacterized protein (TIGR03435 family)
MQVRIWFAAAALIASIAVFAQSTASRPSFTEFEVATIKPTAPDTAGRWIRMQSQHQFTARNHALRTLLAAAYNVSPKAISGGPPWVDSDRFDISARTPHEVRPTLDEQMAMLRKLLTDRFGLRFHREPRELAVYAITVARNGPKLKDSTVLPDASPEGPPPLIFVVAPQRIRLPARYATMGELASVMQRAALSRPVIDKTGLPGRYDFDLEWTPDETQFEGAFAKAADGDSTNAPGLIAAMQEQLGLKLEATKGVVDVLMIDHVEHPSEN